MLIKLPHRLSSRLVGLLGLTAVAVGADAAALAAGGTPRAAAASPATAGAAKTHFMGPHPLAGSPGTGYCYIDVPHVHDFVPDRPAVYQQVGDDYVFTGDPVPFGYEGEKTVFYGHHPVPLQAQVEVSPAPPMTFCFIKGPHYHDYPQPEAPGFKQKDNTVFYIGPIPPEVARERLQRERAVELEYQPYVAQRPQVVVSPPPEWQGVVWSPPPAPRLVAAAPGPVVGVPPAAHVTVTGQAPQLIVSPPSAQVVVAPPSVPSLVVAAPQPGVVVMAPQPGVVVMPPQPHTVLIGAPGPGLVIGAPHPGMIIGAPGPGVVVSGPGHGHPVGKGWKGGGHGWGKGGGHGWGKGGRRRW